MNTYRQFLQANDVGIIRSRREETAKPDDREKRIATIKIPRKFQDDIEILKKLYGEEFKTGLCIKLELQRALEIMPKERKRIDAYNSLAKYLQENEGVTLVITSKKTKTL